MSADRHGGSTDPESIDFDTAIPPTKQMAYRNVAKKRT